MSAPRLRPNLRLPWYAAFAIYGVSYFTWAALNDWNFRPTAFWIIAAIVLGSLYGSRAWLVKQIDKDEAEQPGPPRDAP